MSDRAVEGRYTAHDAITFAIRDVASSLVKNCGEVWAAADDFADAILAALRDAGIAPVELPVKKDGNQ